LIRPEWKFSSFAGPYSEFDQKSDSEIEAINVKRISYQLDCETNNLRSVRHTKAQCKRHPVFLRQFVFKFFFRFEIQLINADL